MYCRLCLGVFPHLLPSVPEPACCPSCGALELMAGEPTRQQRVETHLARFGGIVLLLDALAVAGANVHGYGPGSGWLPNSVVPVNRDTTSLIVGLQHAWVLVDPPRQSPWIWRIRVPVRVDGAAATADMLRTIHDIEISPGLRIEGFVCEQLASASPHTLCCSPCVYVTQLTPWGITFTGEGGRLLGCLDAHGRGRFWVSMVLPHGFGARAASRRASAALSAFQTVYSDDWRAHGFVDATVDGRSPIGTGKHRRWALRLLVRFVATDDVTEQLAWAARHELIEFE